jgi:hypothetical protein
MAVPPAMQSASGGRIASPLIKGDNLSVGEVIIYES